MDNHIHSGYVTTRPSGATAEQAKQNALAGYRHVRRYVEGKQGWADAGLPLESEQMAKAGTE